MAQQAEQHTLGKAFFVRSGLLLRIMFPSFCSITIALFVFLFVLSVVDQVISYYVGVMPSEYYVVLGNKDNDGFKQLAVKSVLIILSKCFSLATISYVTTLLYVHWRKLLGQYLHKHYFTSLSYYKLNCLNTSSPIDNPDQRMTQDVERMCNMLAQIFWQMLIYPFVAIYYTYKTYQSSGYLGPLVIYLYFICGTIFNRFAMRPVVRLTVLQERREGDFRFKHMTIRSNSEAIAFFDAGPLEALLTNKALSGLLKVQSRLIQWQYLLQFCVKTFDYMGSILSYLILGFAIFSLREYDHMSAVELSGVVSRNSFYYMYLINSFSNLIDLSQKFGSMAGNVHRVGELIEYLVEAENSHPMDSSSDGFADDDMKDLRVSTFLTGSSNSFANGTAMIAEDPFTSTESINNPPIGNVSKDKMSIVFHLDKVSISVPNNGSGADLRPVIRDITVNIRRSVRLLITGDSSAGKTSLFRALAGLWPVQSGRITRRSLSAGGAPMFMPQKAYLPLSSLRQQVTYPGNALFHKDAESTKIITDLLELVDLGELLVRTGGLDEDVAWNWQEMLTPGEMQRLSFCRILFNHPDLVFLDEATASVGLEMERRLYSLLMERSIGYVSVGHRLSLKEYHDYELHLNARELTWQHRLLSRTGSFLTVRSSSDVDRA